MTDDTPGSNGRARRGDQASGIDEFAEMFDRQWDAAVDREPGADALDPALWRRIRNGASNLTHRRARARRKASSATVRGEHQSRETHRVPDVPLSVPASQWHRGLLVFAMVVLVGSVMLLAPGDRTDPRHGSVVQEAPQVVTPLPGQEMGCDVEPLTREDVLATVLDPAGQGFTDERALFATPPPAPGAYPHTETWLPEADGTVDMAGGPRDTRVPTATEFRGAEVALDRYLRCQSEGTNFQLWALESPAEVQRQVLVLALARNASNGDGNQPQSPEDLTETMILDTIDLVGPELRAAAGFNIYMFFHEQSGSVDTQANPNPAEALVAENPETGEVEYAWVATEWVDPETGDLLSSRGASLDSTPVSRDGGMDNLVVMILRHDTDQDTWFVEWFVPTI